MFFFFKRKAAIGVRRFWSIEWYPRRASDLAKERRSARRGGPSPNTRRTRKGRHPARYQSPDRSRLTTVSHHLKNRQRRRGRRRHPQLPRHRHYRTQVHV